MYNLAPYNTLPYNNIPPGLVESIFTGDLKLGTIDLKAEGFTVSYNDESRGGKRKIVKNQVPAGNGSITTGDYFTEKIITLRGTLRRATKKDLVDSIDRFLYALGHLEIDFLTRRDCEDLRKYTVKVVNTDTCFDMGKNYLVNHCPFEFKLLCQTPFGVDTINQSEIISGQTSLDLSFEIVYGGSAPGLVDFTVIVNSETAITNIKIQQSGGNLISVDADFQANDILVISGENGTVTLNGSPVKFGGRFHKLDLGGNSFNIISTGTSIDFGLAHVFVNRYQ